MTQKVKKNETHIQTQKTSLESENQRLTKISIVTNIINSTITIIGIVLIIVLL